MVGFVAWDVVRLNLGRGLFPQMATIFIPALVSWFTRSPFDGVIIPIAAVNPSPAPARGFLQSNPRHFTVGAVSNPFLLNDMPGNIFQAMTNSPFAEGLQPGL